VHVATQQDDLLRRYFTGEIAFYNADMFVFLDKGGSERRDSIRKYGYGWRVKPMSSNKLLMRGQHLSIMAFMSTAGLL